MPPKQKKKGGDAESKKAQQKKKQQILEDKTFGLKNKKKSKVVQAQIRSIEKSVLNSGDPRQRKLEEQRKRAKAEAKARKKAAEEERNALFGEALMAVQKKHKHANQKEGVVEARGRDANDDEKKGSTSRAMKMMYQMDAKEMEDKLREDPNYIPTLEDEIESQRQAMVEKILKSGKKGTPVTPETFAAWQDRKRKRRAEEAKKLVEAEMRKKKGGKGLSILSGRDLYEYKKELFADDDDILALLKEEMEDEEEKKQQKEEEEVVRPPLGTKDHNGGVDVEAVAEKVQSDLFLEGDDDDLDDIEDD